jgi:ribose transport system ATP-binding protein
LTGADVTEERIVAAALKADTHGGEAVSKVHATKSHGLRHFFQSDNAPAVPLAIVAILLGLYVYSQNDNFFSIYNIYNILLLATALGFIAMGQTVALLMGGIDLSVGPLAGFLMMLVGAFITGAINGLLIRFADFTPIAATLAMYIAIQGFSFLLRDNPDGYISATVTGWINWQWGPFPVAFLALVVAAVVGEYVLRKTRAGWRLRAVGSDENSSRRAGIRVDLTFITGYVVCSLLTSLGAIMLMTQIGVGDPRQGISYTLSSITAVVLGGTSLAGGRGTFIGTVLGAVLLTEILNAVTFLGLTQTYQYLFQGILVVVAALVYSGVRRRAV